MATLHQLQDLFTNVCIHDDPDSPQFTVLSTVFHDKFRLQAFANNESDTSYFGRLFYDEDVAITAARAWRLDEDSYDANNASVVIKDSFDQGGVRIEGWSANAKSITVVMTSKMAESDVPLRFELESITDLADWANLTILCTIVMQQYGHQKSINQQNSHWGRELESAKHEANGLRNEVAELKYKIERLERAMPANALSQANAVVKAAAPASLAGKGQPERKRRKLAFEDSDEDATE